MSSESHNGSRPATKRPPTDGVDLQPAPNRRRPLLAAGGHLRLTPAARTRVSLALIFSGFFFLKLPLVLTRSLPTLFYDEAYYTYKARNFYQNWSYYAPEDSFDVPNLFAPLYSLALVPALAFTTEPLVAYRLMLIINSLLISSMVFPVYLLAKKICPERRWLATLFANSLTVPFCYSFSVMSEALFVPAFVWAAYLYSRYLDSPGLRNGLALGAAVSILVLTRNAGLPMLGVVVLLTVLSRSSSRFRLATKEEILARLPIAALPLAAGMTWELIKNQHKFAEWQSAPAYARQLPSLMSSLDALAGYFRIWLNQLFYMNLATLGILAFLLFSLLAPPARSRTHDRAGTGLISLHGYVTLASLAMIFASSLKMTIGGSRNDLTRHLMHGRFVDMIVPLIVLYGFAFLPRGDRSVNLPRKVASCLMVAAALLLSSASANFQIEAVRIFNMGAAWYAQLTDSTQPSSLRAVPVLLLFCIVLAASINRKTLMLAIPALLLMNIYNIRLVLASLHSHESEVAADFSSFAEAGERGGRVFFVTGEVSNPLLSKAQFYFHQKLLPYQDHVAVDALRDSVMYRDDILTPLEFASARKELILDLIANFETATLVGQEARSDNPWGSSIAKIWVEEDGGKRRAVYMVPNMKLSYDTVLPDRAGLIFKTRVGFHPFSRSWGSDGMKVELRFASREEAILRERTIRPDEGLRDWDVVLDALKGKSIEVEFQVSNDEGKHQTGDWAIWMEPRIVGEPAGRNRP